jgi:hypothetical protein
MPIKLTETPLKFLGGPTPIKVIQEMVTHYKNNLKHHGDGEIARRHKDRENKNQGSCVWISVIELIQLVTDNGGNGIRVYFGQHTKNSLPDNTPEFEDLITTIFVATRDNKNPADPTYKDSEDLLTSSDDLGKGNTVSIAGPFVGQGDDKVPICNPRCPLVGGMMKISI